MSTPSEQLVYELTHLPTGANPNLWLADRIKASYLPRYSTSVSLQMYFNIGMLELSILLTLGSIFLRYRRGQAWFFRRSVAQTLIQPNIAMVGCVLGLCFMILTNILMFAVLNAATGKLPVYLGYMTLLNGIIPGIAGETVIWSIAASYLGHLNSTQTCDRSLDRWILATNILGIATPFVHVAAFVPLDLVAGRHFARIVMLFREIDVLLRAAASEWTPSTPFSLTSLLPILPYFTLLEEEVVELKPVARSVYVFHLITTVLIILVLTTVASLYLSSVKRLICKAQSDMIDSNRRTELLDQIYQTWTGLVVVVVLVDLIAMTYFGFTVFASIRPLESSQTYVLTLFWTSSILGLLATTVIFWLSWHLAPATPRTGDGAGAGQLDSFRLRVRLYRRGSRFTGAEGGGGGATDMMAESMTGIGRIVSVVPVLNRIDSGTEKGTETGGLSKSLSNG
ncbi:hypothetical protein JCM11491_006083 [Sporobolomyces phaffii]